MHDLDLHPTASKLRQFGWTALVAFGLIGLALRVRGELFGLGFGAAGSSVACALWTLGALSGLFSLVWPRGNRPLYLALSIGSFPIGWVVSHVLLAVLFYGLLTPLGLLFRVLGRDPLERRFSPEETSYWRDLPETNDNEDYFRQF
jgi:hypothetical protein